MDENIKVIIEKLKLELYKIQCKNWVASVGTGNSASGKTLEHLLGKEEDRDVLPDYIGIELKTRNKYSNYPLNLFSCALDNKPLEMQRLLKIGGYPDKNNPQYKVFQIKVDALSDKKVGKYLYKLHVNYDKEIVELLIKQRLTGSIYTKMSWSFRELKSRLEHKMKYLAIVSNLKERVNGKEYFKYYDAHFYKLRGFDKFLKLMESGSITVSFKLTYYHSVERFGEYLDKGTGFEIAFSDIPFLFEEV